MELHGFIGADAPKAREGCVDRVVCGVVSWAVVLVVVNLNEKEALTTMSPDVLPIAIEAEALLVPFGHLGWRYGRGGDLAVSMEAPMQSGLLPSLAGMARSAPTEMAATIPRAVTHRRGRESWPLADRSNFGT